MFRASPVPYSVSGRHDRIERQHVDGRIDVGSRATYSFADPHTLVLHEECDTCALSGFTITPTPDGLRLKLIGAPPTEQEAVSVRFLFEYGPFVRTP
jgi:hypothetical protein